MEEINELDKIKPTTNATLKIHGKEREFKFGFSVWAKIEEEYNGLKNLSKMEKEIEERPFHVIPHLMFMALVDKEGVTEENIFDEYGLNDLPLITDVFKNAFYGSMPIDDNIAEKKMLKK